MPRKPKRRFGGKVNWSSTPTSGRDAALGALEDVMTYGDMYGLGFGLLSAAMDENQRQIDVENQRDLVQANHDFRAYAEDQYARYMEEESQKRWVKRHTLTDQDIADIKARYEQQYNTAQAGAEKDVASHNAVISAEAQQRAANQASIEAAKRADMLAASQQRIANIQSQSAARNAASKQTVNIIQSEVASMRNAAQTTAQIRAQEAQTRLQTQKKEQDVAMANALHTQQLHDTLLQHQQEQEAARMGANVVNPRRLPPIVSVTGVRS